MVFSYLVKTDMITNAHNYLTQESQANQYLLLSFYTINFQSNFLPKLSHPSSYFTLLSHTRLSLSLTKHGLPTTTLNSITHSRLLWPKLLLIAPLFRCFHLCSFTLLLHPLLSPLFLTSWKVHTNHPGLSPSWSSMCWNWANKQHHGTFFSYHSWFREGRMLHMFESFPR